MVGITALPNVLEHFGHVQERKLAERQHSTPPCRNSKAPQVDDPGGPDVFGQGRWVRTNDLRIPSAALCQTELGPDLFGGSGTDSNLRST